MKEEIIKPGIVRKVVQKMEDNNIAIYPETVDMGIIGGIDEVCFNRDRLFFGGKGQVVLHPDFDSRINAESIIEKYWNDDFEQYNYIPPIILGEETVNGITRQWIIDGLQRSSTLSMFRYANTKITKNIDDYMVTYQRKVTDESGNIKRDAQGEIVWESVEYDIRNKTYEQLPEELKDRFNGYQIETVIHQECDTTEVSKLVRKYNNNKPMNQAQRAFTYVDAFAREIREITENRFFLDMYSCSRKDRINGTFERVIGDMVLLANYPDHYRKDTKVGFKWLNENATMKDFYKLDELLTRLTESTEITPEIRALFNSKSAYIFVAAFKAFTEMEREDKEFGEFLEWFVNGGNETEINGNAWEVLDADRSTRDSSTVHGKLDYLVELIKRYFTEIKKVA